MNFKIWYSLCILFFIINLNSLIEDYNEIKYEVLEKDNELYNHHINYLLCIKIDVIKKKDKLFGLENQTNLSAEIFLNYSKSSIEYNLNKINLINLNNSFIFFDFFCFIVDKSDLEENSQFGYYDNYLYIYSIDRIPFLFESIFNQIEKNEYYFKVHLNTIYGPDYLNPKHENPETEFHCLNECSGLKYTKNKTILDNKIGLKSQSNSIGIIKITQIFSEKCLKKCENKYASFYEFHISVRINETYYNDVIKKENIQKIDFSQTIFFPYYSTNDFWFKFFSLFFLLTGSSFIQIAHPIIIWSIEKFKKPNSLYFRFILSKLKLILIIFCLLYILIKGIFMYKEYRFKFQFPNKTNILKFSFENKADVEFSPIICFPILILINHTDENEAMNEIDRKNDQILNDLTFNEIKLKTDDAYKEQIINISLKIGFEEKNIMWSIRKQEILFRNNTINNQTYLSRCYSIEIKIKEMKYESLMPINTLAIHLRTKLFDLYLIEKNDQFSTFTNYFKGEFFLEKETIKNSARSLKSNCVDYRNFKTEFECKSRLNCIDKCIQFEFKKKYEKITIYSVINGEQLDKSIKFANFNDLNIEKRCLELFKKDDCKKATYFESLKTCYSFKPKSIFLNLNYENRNIIESDQSFINFILEIMNLESIFLGTNILNLFIFINLIVTNRIKKIKRIQNLRKKFKKLIKFKISELLILSICIIGYLIHNLNIFRGIINSQLIESIHFQKIEYIEIPNTIFCFELKKSLNLNHKLTGNYLDEISSDLNFSNIFQFLWYYNTTHRINLQSNKLGKSNTEILFKHFYYLNHLKCFEIQLNVKFKKEHFFSLESKYSFGLYFNTEFSKKNKIVYFLYRKSETKQFSNAYYFKTNNNFKYTILFEKFKFTKFDVFEKIKHPELLLSKKANSNDATIYLNQTRDDYKEITNLTTRKILLERNNFELEIDDNLFEQYYLQIQNYTDYAYPVSSNYDKNFYNLYGTYYKNSKNDTGFLFSTSFAERIIEITNESNFIKLLINLLNSLSFWFSICILDLHIYFNKLTKLIRKFILLSNFFNRHLINLKFYFKNKCF